MPLLTTVGTAAAQQPSVRPKEPSRSRLVRANAGRLWTDFFDLSLTNSLSLPCLAVLADYGEHLQIIATINSVN